MKTIGYCPNCNSEAYEGFSKCWKCDAILPAKSQMLTEASATDLTQTTTEAQALESGAPLTEAEQKRIQEEKIREERRIAAFMMKRYKKHVIAARIATAVLIVILFFVFTPDPGNFENLPIEELVPALGFVTLMSIALIFTFKDAYYGFIAVICLYGLSIIVSLMYGSLAILSFGSLLIAPAIIFGLGARGGKHLKAAKEDYWKYDGILDDLVVQENK